MRAGALGLIAVAWSLVAIGACAPLEPLREGACGNGVIEPGSNENCDTFAEPDQLCLPPGDPHECRYACGAAYEGKHCPAGMGCGTDGLCRRPSGSFEQTESIATGLNPSLTVTDLNADGLDDLIATSVGVARTILFNDVGSSKVSESVSSKLPFVSAGKLNTDDMNDLVTAPADSFPDSVMVFTSESNGTLSPVAYGAEPIQMSKDDISKTGMFVYNAFPTKVGSDYAPLHAGDEAVVWTSTEPRLLYWNGDKGENRYAFINSDLPPFDQTVAQHVGHFDMRYCQHDPAWCNYRQLAFLAADQSYVGVTRFVPSSEKKSSLELETINVRIPPECQRTKDFLVGDVDGDGLQDLIVWQLSHEPAGNELASSIPTTTCVAFGQGDGTFHSRSTVDEDDTTAPNNTFGKMALKPKIFRGPLLAVADFNNDQHLDYLFSGSLALSIAGKNKNGTDAIGYMSLQLPPGTPNLPVDKPVYVADFNKDGFADVLAMEEGGLVLLTGSPMGAFTRKRLETIGKVQHVALGDLDGDGFTDVAFNENYTRTNKQNNELDSDSLSVSYGSPAGGLIPPVSFGQFAKVLGMGAGIMTQSSQFDAADDLLVIASIQSESSNNDQSTSSSDSGSSPTYTTNLALFTGRADRRLISPFRLAAAISTDEISYDAAEADQVIAIALGSFLATNESKETSTNSNSANSNKEPTDDIAALTYFPASPQNSNPGVRAWYIPVQGALATIDPQKVKPSGYVLESKSGWKLLPRTVQAVGLKLDSNTPKQSSLIVFGTAVKDMSVKGVVAIGHVNDDNDKKLHFAFEANDVKLVDELFGFLFDFTDVQPVDAGSNPPEDTSTKPTHNSYVRRRDVNHDGLEDLVVLGYQIPKTESDNEQPVPVIVILLNNGDGQLDLRHKQIFTASPQDTPSIDDNLTVTDFDVMPSHPGIPTRVLLAFSSSSSSSSDTSDLRAYELVPGQDGANGTLEQLPLAVKSRSPSSVRIADYNGDGVPDIAVGLSSGSIQIFRQKAVLP